MDVYLCDSRWSASFDLANFWETCNIYTQGSFPDSFDDLEDAKNAATDHVKKLIGELAMHKQDADVCSILGTKLQDGFSLSVSTCFAVAYHGRGNAHNSNNSRHLRPQEMHDRLFLNLANINVSKSLSELHAKAV
jgi:hypothetical protein